MQFYWNKKNKHSILKLALIILIVLIWSCASSKSIPISNEPSSGSVASLKPTVSTELVFSKELSKYPKHPSAQILTVEEIFNRTSTPNISLSPEYIAKRKEIVKMYKTSGIDLSLDKERLMQLRPTQWSNKTPQPLDDQYIQAYSIDTPFYQKIPTDWPRVQLPRNYFKSGHISTLGSKGDGSDGFGIGVVVSKATDPLRQVSLANGSFVRMPDCPVHNSYKGYNTKIHIKDDANVRLKGSGAGVPYDSSDRTVVWLDSSDNSIVATWGTVPDCDRPDLGTQLGDWSGEAVTRKESLPNLGDRSGINAAGKSDLVTLIRPGEAINPNGPIPHALSGPVKDAWKAIVYPANNTDNTIDQNNRGLLGYGFLVQLDPTIDLKAMNLSLPARRILEAIQTYGWYMDDTGVRDFDIKGNFSAAEFASYGGVEAVDAEILSILKTQQVYVVPPLVKS